MPIFGISGLRGRIGQDLTAQLAAEVAAAFGVLAQGTVAVGRDSRLTGGMLTKAVTAGLMSAGCDVEDLGICPTPTVLHHVKTGKCQGGIVITASHNPEEWNGMKFLNTEGTFLSPEELARLKKLVATDSIGYAAWDGTGTTSTNTAAIPAHIEAIVEHPVFSRIAGSAVKPIRVGIDAVNGAASVAASELVRAFGAEPVEINCRTDLESLRKGFPRRPEPTADHLDELGRLVREERLDFGVGLDPDGDRAGFVDETGRPLGEERTICLACMSVLPRLVEGTESSTGGGGHPPVVVNLSTTRAVEDVCRKYSTPVDRSPVGEACVTARMRETGALLGGEGNGGVILRDLNFTRDALVAISTVLDLLSTSGRTLSSFSAEIPDYRMVKTTLTLGRDHYAARVDVLVNRLAPAHVDRNDGIKLDGDDWWIHIRPSNTEPVIRVIAEAKGRSPAPEVDKARALLAG